MISIIDFLSRLCSVERRRKRKRLRDMIDVKYLELNYKLSLIVLSRDDDMLSNMVSNLFIRFVCSLSTFILIYTQIHTYVHLYVDRGRYCCFSCCSILISDSIMLEAMYFFSLLFSLSFSFLLPACIENVRSCENRFAFFPPIYGNG